MMFMKGLGELNPPSQDEVKDTKRIHNFLTTGQLQ